MSYDLNNIIEQITPENIKNIPLIDESLDIFIDFIKENSDICIDVKNVFDDKKEILHEEFLKTYLNNVYTIFQESGNNAELYDKLKYVYNLVGVDIEQIELLKNINSYLTSEHLLTNKEFKESKGTKLAFEYVYNLVQNSGILGDYFNQPGQSSFKYSEGPELFEYHIEGSIIAEAYELFIKPITHPLGWRYTYSRIIEDWWNDYFNLKFNYTFSDFKITCINGNEDNYITNLGFDGLSIFPTLADAEVTFIEVNNIGTSIRRIITFVNGWTLESYSDPISNKLYDNNRNIIRDYDLNSHCSLLLNYSVLLELVTQDNVEFNVHNMFDEIVLYTICGPALVGATVAVEGYDLKIGEFIIGENCVKIKINDSISYEVEINSKLNKACVYNRIGNFLVGALLSVCEPVDDAYIMQNEIVQDETYTLIYNEVNDVFWSTQTTLISEANIGDFLITGSVENFTIELVAP